MKNNTKKNGKKMKTIICGATILGVVGVSGIFAYLTDTDNADNKFTVGDVKIELYEPDWDGYDTSEEHPDTPKIKDEKDQNKNNIPDVAENLTANQEIDKDPQVKNKGNNSAYVFLKVQVPKEEVVTAQENGTKEERQEKELFTYTKNSNWEELSTERKDEEIEGKKYSTHIYCYKKALEPNVTTEPLFESVRLINIVEDVSLNRQNFDIKIEAYAIQSDNLLGSSVEEIEGDLDEFTGDAIYNIYKNQNK